MNLVFDCILGNRHAGMCYLSNELLITNHSQSPPGIRRTRDGCTGRLAINCVRVPNACSSGCRRRVVVPPLFLCGWKEESKVKNWDTYVGKWRAGLGGYVILFIISLHPWVEISSGRLLLLRMSFESDNCSDGWFVLWGKRLQTVTFRCCANGFVETEGDYLLQLQRTSTYKLNWI
jgi:hypothetical protein